MNYYYKSSDKRTFLGVVGRLSDYFGLDYTWARIIFVVLIFLSSGFLLPVYFLGALFVPRINQATHGIYRPRFYLTLWYNIRYLFKTVGKHLKQMFMHLTEVLKQTRFARLYGLVFIVLGILWLRQEPQPWAIVFLSLGLFILGASIKPIKNLAKKSFWQTDTPKGHYH